jgi:hypothetical protein
VLIDTGRINLVLGKISRVREVSSAKGGPREVSPREVGSRELGLPKGSPPEAGSRTDRKNKRHFRATTPAARPPAATLHRGPLRAAQRAAAASPERPRARRSTALRGAAWLWLVLDRRLRMDRGAPQGCSGATASGRATWEGWGEDFKRDFKGSSGMRHTSTAHTSPPRPRVTSWA